MEHKNITKTKQLCALCRQVGEGVQAHWFRVQWKTYKLTAHEDCLESLRDEDED